jgi:hypothetical protein
MLYSKENGINKNIKGVWFILLFFAFFLYDYLSFNIAAINSNWYNIVLAHVLGRLLTCFGLTLGLWLIFTLIRLIVGNNDYIPTFFGTFLTVATIALIISLITSSYFN